MSSTEICYRIQYPVRNNRDRGDPFSMRQIGICQKNNGPRNSAWIILQPSLEVRNRLELTMNGQDFISVYEADPMSLHLIFLDFQSINWDAFVEHLRISLQPLVCFIDQDKTPSKADFFARLMQLISPGWAAAANIPSRITLWSSNNVRIYRSFSGSSIR